MALWELLMIREVAHLGTTNNSKTPSTSTTTSSVVYLEKMLAEDTYITDPSSTITTTSVVDSLPDDLQLTQIVNVMPQQPEFKFYTNKNYSELYIQVISNSSGISDGWLKLNDDSKFEIALSISTTEVCQK